MVWNKYKNVYKLFINISALIKDVEGGFKQADAPAEKEIKITDLQGRETGGEEIIQVVKVIVCVCVS